ncbi:MAG TPA: Trm112 family protein [Pseudonocardiaceae bacterium]|nr:Trm112 family protein [Pseudonocardiaceae bacterium]
MAVELDPQLLEILACPSSDHAPLKPGTPDDPQADALTCTSCGRVYPVRDGIPVLLLDEVIAGPTGERAPVDGQPPAAEQAGG